MKPMTESAQVKESTKTWQGREGLGGVYAELFREKGERLMRLDPDTATAADIREIIGANDWAVQQSCDECGKMTWDIVELGKADVVYLCGDCLSAALRLLEEK